MSETIAVIGGSGFVGAFVVERLRALGFGALTVQRGLASAKSVASGEAVICDREDVDRLKAVLRDHDVKSVIDLGAMTAAGTEPVARAVAGVDAHYVLTSSADVYAAFGALLGQDVVEGDASLDERAPLRRRRYPYRGSVARSLDDPQRFLDDYDKILVEEVARQVIPETVILRLGMIYGPGDRQHRFGWMVQACDADVPVRIDRRAARWRATHAYVEDVAQGIASAALAPGVVGRTFNLGMAETLTTSEWMRELAKTQGLKIEIEETLPGQGGALEAMAETMNLSSSLVLDTRRARVDLGYGDVVSLQDGLSRTAAWERAQTRDMTS